MADDAKDELRALVVRARQEKKQGPFPQTLRQRLLRYALERWHAGVSVKSVANELGVSVATLSYWRARTTVSKEAKLRPVTIVEKPIVERLRRVHVALGPCGTRVEDLSLDEVAELFRKLS